MDINNSTDFIEFPNGFKISANVPIDFRYLGETTEFLQLLIDQGVVYPGLKVFIKSKNKTYTYRKEGGTYGEYKFIEDDFSFTEDQLAVLSSGITKEKLAELEKKYKIPSTGIPENELSAEVKSKLEKAANALTQETDPTVPSWAKQPNKPSYTIKEVEGLEKALQGKVNSDGNKGLSDENFTSSEKTKLAKIPEGSQENVIEKVSVNGVDQTISGKKVGISLKTVNGQSLAGAGDIKVVDLENDQNIKGAKNFESHVLVGPKSDIELDPAKANNRAVATEAQVAKAIKSLGKTLTPSSPIDASRLYGELPDTLVFPILNQDTTGNAKTADTLKTPRMISLKGKVVSDKVSFNGSSDIEIEVTRLSSNPADYPTFNQNTTGNAGTASKLAIPRKLKVNLASTANSVFDGSEDLEEIPIKGRLPLSNFIQGAGLGTKRRVLGTGKSVAGADLSLVELTPSDIGLDKVINEKQATEAQLNELAAKINRLEALGSFVGAFDTYDDLPKTITEISSKYGVDPKVNDFVTVRGGDYPEGSFIPNGSATCWSIVAIDGNKVITWAYESTYDFDISGKADRVTGSNLEGCIPKLSSTGNLVNSGKKLEDIVLYEDLVIPGSTVTVREKIRNSLLSTDIIYGSRKLIHPSTTDPCEHGSSHQPVYFEDGTPVACSDVAAVDEQGYVKGLDPEGNRNVDLKIKQADLAKVSIGAKTFVDEGGHPATQGGSLQPIYLDGEGKPKAIPKSLGDFAFENLIDPSVGEDVFLEGEDSSSWTSGKLRVYKNNSGTGDRLKLELVPDSNSGEEICYGLVTPSVDSADGSDFKLKELKVCLEDLGIPIKLRPESKEGLIQIDRESHGILSVIPNVRIFEIKSRNSGLGTSKAELEVDNIILSENYGMSEVSLSGNITIKVASTPYYNSLTDESQGIYLIAISK